MLGIRLLATQTTLVGVVVEEVTIVNSVHLSRSDGVQLMKFAIREATTVLHMENGVKVARKRRVEDDKR